MFKCQLASGCRAPLFENIQFKFFVQLAEASAESESRLTMENFILPTTRPVATKTG